jgi:hypothetical protein
MLDIHGDTWVWIAFAPMTKVVPAWVAGKRTRQESIRLIQRVQSSTDGHIPFFTSDELPPYAAALLDVYGQTVVPPRTGRPGRPRSAYKVPPDDLLYAIVSKRRKRGRIVEVTTHVVYGTPERLAQALADYTGGNMGMHHPISWYHEYDGGRAWYTAMGHTTESYSDLLFLSHVLRRYQMGSWSHNGIE